MALHKLGLARPIVTETETKGRVLDARVQDPILERSLRVTGATATILVRVFHHGEGTLSNVTAVLKGRVGTQRVVLRGPSVPPDDVGTFIGTTTLPGGGTEPFVVSIELPAAKPSIAPPPGSKPQSGADRWTGKVITERDLPGDADDGASE